MNLMNSFIKKIFYNVDYKKYYPLPRDCENYYYFFYKFFSFFKKKMSSNIYLLKGENELLKIASVDNDYNIKLDFISQINDVNNINKNIIKYIILDSSYPNTPVFLKNYKHVFSINNIDDCFLIQSDDIYSLIIDIWRYRRCTVYVILQKSNVGYRILIYLYDKIMHTSANFGIGIDSIIDSLYLKYNNIWDKIKLLLNDRTVNDKYKIDLFKSVLNQTPRFGP